MMVDTGRVGGQNFCPATHHRAGAKPNLETSSIRIHHLTCAKITLKAYNASSLLSGHFDELASWLE